MRQPRQLRLKFTVLEGSNETIQRQKRLSYFVQQTDSSKFDEYTKYYFKDRNDDARNNRNRQFTR